MFAHGVSIDQEFAELVKRTGQEYGIKELSVILGEEPRVRLFKGDRAPDRRELERWTEMSAPLCKELARNASFTSRLVFKTNMHPQKRQGECEVVDVCAFCNGALSEANEQGCCQRCEFGGSGQLVAVTFLHDLNDTHWKPRFKTRTLAVKAGQVLIFDASKRPQDVQPNKPATARISIEVQVQSDKLQGIPSSPQVLGLLRLAYDHFAQHKSLQAREAFNSQWLFDLFAENGLPPVAESARIKGCRTGFGVAGLLEDCKPTTGEVFGLWLQTSQPRALLARKIDSFSPGEFKLTKKTKRATERIRNEAVYATHLVFMMTDWLLWPHWFSGDKLLAYIEQAHAVLLPNREREVELYLELAGCLAVLKKDGALFSKTRKFIDTLDWDEALAREVQATRKKRFAEDVKLHMLILRAWFISLDDQWQQLQKCLSY